MNSEHTDTASGPAWHHVHSTVRTDAYVLLASLLNTAPTATLVNLLPGLQWHTGLPENVHQALAELIRCGETCSLEEIEEEYSRLFVGLGHGELIPYGSWYLEKEIQSWPLAIIRADLWSLGVMRQSDSCESEDHAGALCEIMALLSMAENEIPEEQQALFYQRHLEPWMSQFFTDMQRIKNIQFYKQVGIFGEHFLRSETEYLDRIGSAATV